MSNLNTTPSSRPGTVFCILCNGIVSYKKGDRKRFEDHMNIEHGAFYNLDFILAGCLMSKDERQVIFELIDEKLKSNSGNECNEDDDNVNELSILDRAFPLVNTATTSDVLTKAKSESFVGEENDFKVQCELCESRISRTNVSRHLIKVHKLGTEERAAILRSLNRKIKDEIPECGDSGHTKIEDSPTFTENSTNKSNEVDNMCQDDTNNDESIYKSDSVVGEEDNNKVNCSFCEVRITRRNLSRHLIRVHKLGKEERNTVFQSMNYQKYKNESSDHGIESEKSVIEHTELTIENLSQRSNDVDEESQFVANDVKSDITKCHLCDAKFSRSNNLKIHIARQHPEENSLKCTFCAYSCNEQKSLKFHVAAKHKDKDPKVKGSLAESSAVSSLLGDQIKETTLICDLCDYSSTKESNLKTHKTLKHKSKEKLNEKLCVSKSLFKKSTSISDETVGGKACNKCEYIASSNIDFRRHRFKNHRHELMRKGVKVEEEDVVDGENLLIEGPAISLDLNDMSIEIDENEFDSSHNKPNKGDVGVGTSRLSKEEYEIFCQRRVAVIEKSEYFRKCSKNIQTWSGSDDDLVPAESFMPGFGVKNCITGSGRKYCLYVTPNRHFKLRSLVAVLEYMKISEEFTEEDVRTLEVKLKAKTL